MIDKRYLQESWTPGVTNQGIEFPYGYGWHLEMVQGSKTVFHTGSTRGFRNIIYRIPEKNFTIIILTNRNGGPESITLDLVRRILDNYFP